MTFAALGISLCALVVSIVFAIRQERWRKHEFEISTEARRLEAADREEQIELQRYQVEHDRGWVASLGQPTAAKRSLT